MKRICFVLFLILLFSVCLDAKVKKIDPEAPKNVKILSQSCNISTLFVTVIDLDNNEIVILEYNYDPFDEKLVLMSSIRTGMFVDPNKQTSYKGTDAPFENPKNS